MTCVVSAITGIKYFLIAIVMDRRRPFFLLFFTIYVPRIKAFDQKRTEEKIGYLKIYYYDV